MKPSELNVIVSLLHSGNKELAEAGIEICIANRKDPEVRDVFVRRLLDLCGKGLYLPHWDDSRAILKIMKEEAKHVLYDHENVRLNNKIAERSIGLANTTGDVILK